MADAAERGFAPAPGEVLAGRYRLERAVAKGGMGTVWLAQHLELELPVAIKFMEAPDDLPNARSRFEREAKAAAKLRSPHVVQVLDYGVDLDTPFLVMELLEGEDLRKRLDRFGRLTLMETARIVRDVAKGLALAHDAGIVHRDIKPSNVFLAKVGNDEVAKVLDFGVAKALAFSGSGEQTTSSNLLGSPAYMSPEQARGMPLTAATDAWSLAVVAYVALTGEHPFSGENVGDLLVRICTDPLEPATARLPSLPLSVDTFFERALCRSPDGRFRDVTALADELMAIAEGHDDEQPMPRDEATLDVTGRVEPTLARQTQAMETTGPTTAVTRDAARSQAGSRAWLWAVVGAGLVSLAWFATRSMDVSPVEPGAAATATSEASTSKTTTSETTSTPTASAAPPLAPSTEPTSSASAAAGPPLEVVPAPPRNYPRPAPRPSPPPPSGVDPKFGL